MSFKILSDFNLKGCKSKDDKGWEYYGIGFSYGHKEEMRMLEFTCIIFTIGIGWVN